ncbi:MAG: TetR/AcrR family transcriptional regulator [Eubacterium sp.]
MAYKKSKETKEKILKTAKESFYKQGFKKTTIRGLAETAEVNQALIYYYFSSKYDLAHHIIDEHYYRASTVFKNYIDPDEDLFLFTLVLVRAVLREVYQNPRDLELYLHAYEKPYCDKSQVEYCMLVCKEYGMPIDQRMAEVAVLSTTSVWSQLYFNKEMLSKTINLNEIRDTTDILRWGYLGFHKEIILEKIEKAYEKLEKIPILKIPLLDSEG